MVGMTSTTTPGTLGVCAGNEIADYQQFKAWTGGKLNFVNIFFNQESRAKFMEGRLWQLERGTAIASSVGATPIYSVPFPGTSQLECENVAKGEWDDMYKDLFARMLVSHPTGEIVLRPPWEGNLKHEYQTLSAVGLMPYWLRGWRKMSMLAKISSSRFKIVWCPNVSLNEIDPMTLYPWQELADIFAQDIYIPDQAWVPNNLFDIHKTNSRGLDWMVNLGIQKNKKIAYTEWGVEADRHAPQMDQLCTHIKSLPNLHHHCLWNRDDGPIGGRLDNGARTVLASIYLGHFA